MAELKNNFTNIQFSGFRDIAKAVPFTSHGKSLFYAGERGNWGRAATYAQANGMKPITQTKGGKILDHYSKNGGIIKAFGKQGSYSIWDSASRSYAASVSGQVKTFVAGATDRSTFRRVELPTLLNNKKVEKINGIDRVKLDQFRRQTFNRLRNQGISKVNAADQAKTATYRKVSIVEIRQDLKQAKSTDNKALHADCLQRLSDLKAQHKSEIKVKSQNQGQAQVKPHEQVTQKTQAKPQDRQKAIYDRAYNQAVQKGLSAEQAQKTANIKVKHVTERHELNKARQDAFKKADRASAQSYVAKRQDHRENTIRDRQELAKSTSQTYKGPALMPEKFKEVDSKIKVREMYTRAQLEKNKREGHVSEREYKPLKDRNEANLSQSRSRDISSYFESYGQQKSSAQSQAGSSFNQSASSSSDSGSYYTTEAASYGYSAYSYSSSFNSSATTGTQAKSYNESYGVSKGAHSHG